MTSFANTFVTSIFGRRLGLTAVTSSITGSTIGPQASPAGRVGEFIVGPEDIRISVTTAETSGVSLAPWGLSLVSTASVAATTMTAYTLDKPIPGIIKYLQWGSSNTATNGVSVFSSSDGSITIESCQGSTMCCMVSSAGYRGTIALMGQNSTSWAVIGGLSTGVLTMTTKTS